MGICKWGWYSWACVPFKRRVWGLYSCFASHSPLSLCPQSPALIIASRGAGKINMPSNACRGRVKMRRKGGQPRKSQLDVGPLPPGSWAACCLHHCRHARPPWRVLQETRLLSKADPRFPGQEHSQDVIAPLGTPDCCFINLGIMWLCPCFACSPFFSSPPPPYTSSGSVY